MKKVLLILQAIFYYLMQLPIIVLATQVVSENEEVSEVFMYVNIGIALLFTQLAVIVVTILLILSIKGILKKDSNSYKEVMILKLSLIPFFAINFFLWFCLFGASLNPFLLLTTPFIIFFGCSITFIFMVATSLLNLSYLISTYCQTKDKKLIKHIIFHFIFCVDVIDSVYLYTVSKK